MVEKIGTALFVAVWFFIWLTAITTVGRLGTLKGRESCLWVVSAIVVPLSVLVTIPLLLILPSKREDQIDWHDFLQGMLRTMRTTALASVIIGLVGFVVQYFINP